MSNCWTKLIHISKSRLLDQQEARLSQTDRAMLRVIEYFAKSFLA